MAGESPEVGMKPGSYPLIIPALAVAALAACSAPAAETAAPTGEAYAPTIEPANFVAEIDNPYWPLVPGATFIYEGQTDDGLEHNEVSVTHDTKTVMGVPCTVVRDTVWLDGEKAEETFDWYAQDRDGNVWYFGEDSKEYENGQVASTAGSWEAGVDGALPGIVMWANPTVGESYRQEYYAGEAEDMTEVVSLDESVTVPYGSFDSVLRSREWTQLEPRVVEYKYYASGVGLVLETSEDGQQRIELIDITTE